MIKLIRTITTIKKVNNIGNNDNRSNKKTTKIIIIWKTKNYLVVKNTVTKLKILLVTMKKNLKS